MLGDTEEEDDFDDNSGNDENNGDDDEAEERTFGDSDKEPGKVSTFCVQNCSNMFGSVELNQST